MTHEAGNRQGRTRAQLREHYEVERELADALRRAGPHERRSLYATLYDELFRRVPHHPQLTRKVTPPGTCSGGGEPDPRDSSVP
jgi:hypothetical protein